MSKTKHQTESSKSNYIMPLLLLVVSVIVILSTFNTDENNDKNLTTQNNKQTDSVSLQQSDALNDSVALTEDNSAKNSEEDSNTIAQEISPETTLVSAAEETETPATIVGDANTIENADVSIQPVQSNTQTDTEQVTSHAKSTSTDVQQELVTTQEEPQYNQQQRQYNYNAGVARAQEQARQHYTMMQQRRHTYEQDMLSRRQHYDAAMKARRNKNSERFEAQKALFQNAQQNRLAIKQKIQHIHNKISVLHEELHQLMRESQYGYRTPVTIDNNDQLEITSEKI